jgi:hypothetical protein
MAQLTRNALSLNGNVNMGAAEANAVAVSASDAVTNIDGKTLLYISNQGGSTDNVGIAVQNSTQYTAAGVPVTPAAIAVAIATTERRILGPFSPSIYNDASGNLQITHSFLTTVKVYAISLP